VSITVRIRGVIVINPWIGSWIDLLRGFASVILCLVEDRKKLLMINSI